VADLHEHLDEPASLYGPVTDWATDFDHADPEYNPNAHEIWADLRDRCPVAHTERFPSRRPTCRASPTTPTTSPRGRWW
jgi:hypothetical protein